MLCSAMAAHVGAASLLRACKQRRAAAGGTNRAAARFRGREGSSAAVLPPTRPPTLPPTHLLTHPQMSAYYATTDTIRSVLPSTAPPSK